ncbi:hypothetical protein TCAL_06122 [Tigriopus californicus]|uniref:Uncharacterized protein n=1 Tax=Tigriopus californicus TaxID=6832 RepID=A0A553NX53_TIGCA|nr:hypothetical protein TCAL_06122 [Tigriopus californicus]
MMTTQADGQSVLLGILTPLEHSSSPAPELPTKGSFAFIQRAEVHWCFRTFLKTLSDVSFVCGECRLDRGHDNGQHGERNTSYCPDVLLSKAQPESVL